MNFPSYILTPHPSLTWVKSGRTGWVGGTDWPVQVLAPEPISALAESAELDDENVQEMLQDALTDELFDGRDKLRDLWLKRGREHDYGEDGLRSWLASEELGTLYVFHSLADYRAWIVKLPALAYGEGWPSEMLEEALEVSTDYLMLWAGSEARSKANYARLRTQDRERARARAAASKLQQQAADAMAPLRAARDTGPIVPTPSSSDSI